MKEGWICPKCGAGVNPDRDSCPCVVVQPGYFPPTYIPYPSPTILTSPQPWYGPWCWQTTCISDSTQPIAMANG